MENYTFFVRRVKRKGENHVFALVLAQLDDNKQPISNSLQKEFRTHYAALMAGKELIETIRNLPY